MRKISYFFRVIKTRNGEFPLGTLVLAFSGWRSHYLSKDGKDLQPIPFDLGSLSPSVALGVLGMPG
jgi:prostaglandin reductase 1